ncbi:MAG: D-alanine--D-alanine ligase [Phycisphaerales bacterium]|nr:D-alanine--D-alanine ligase [Phycisphaerales bacterium]
MHVILLHDAVPPDARADEMDTLVQIDAVGQALTEMGHTCSAVAFQLDLSGVAHSIRRERPDLVFNLVESVGSRGSLIYLAPALLDTLRVPYTGAPTPAMFLTSGKIVAKQLLAAHGIATPQWFSIDDLRGATTIPVGRYIVKSAWEDASVGLDDHSIVQTDRADELSSILTERAEGLGGEAFAERFVDGREFNLSLLAEDEGVRVLPAAEIRFDGYPADKPRIVGYAAKWDSESYEYANTPRTFNIETGIGPLIDEMTGIARRCWRLFGLRGYGRVDFRVDADGRPWVLEANANPCLSPDGGFAAAALQSGVDYPRVIERIVSDALRAAPVSVE